MALSIGFIRFVSSADATQAKGLLTFAPVGLPPTEHVCFYWTHSFGKILANRRLAADAGEVRLNIGRPLSAIMLKASWPAIF
jgi:hypothetical protein